MTPAVRDIEETDTPPATVPRWLLWTTAAAAAVLGIAASWLWGMNGEAWIFDLIATYCG
jgi:hypothetical protein